MTARRTILYLPEAVEALLSETRCATLLDNRVIDVLLPSAPELGRARESFESDSEYAARAWHDLLPDHGSAVLPFRLRFGWTTAEIDTIVELLATARKELLRLAGIVEIGSETLRADAEQCTRMIEEWRS